MNAVRLARRLAGAAGGTAVAGVAAVADVAGCVGGAHGERAFADAEALFRGLVQAAPDGMVIVDGCGAISRVNARAQEMFGYAVADLVGRPVLKLVPPAGPEQARELEAMLDPSWQTAAKGTVIELVGRRQDGGRFPIEVSLSPLEVNGQVFTAAAIRDITARRAVERELRDARDQSESILDSMREGYCLTIDNRIAAVNRSLCEMTGFSEAELVGARAPYPFWPSGTARGSEVRDDSVIARGGGTFELSLQRRDGGRFDAEITARRARRKVSGATTFVNTVRDVTAYRRQERERAALGTIARLVAERAGQEIVFEQISREMLALFSCETAALGRFDRHAGEIELSGLTADGRSTGTSVRLPLDGQSACAEVHRTGRLACVHTLVSDELPEEARGLTEELGLSTMFAAPIRVAGELWGVVSVTFRESTRLDDVAQRLERFAELASLAVASALSWETLSRRAATDPLTGLANQRTFRDRLRAEIALARRHGQPFSLVLIDLDRFKQVNDTFGHPIGDRVLVELADRLREHSRESELVARIGGEEFAWLIPGADADGAFRAAERMRRAIEAMPFEFTGAMTASLGVATSEHGDDADEIVRAADRALYRAKEAGRNMSVLWQPDGPARESRPEGDAERIQAMVSLRALARTIDAKDPGTRRHSERVAQIAQRLALELGWTGSRAQLLFACGLLHDVGKIGIPDAILMKPSRLTAEERAEIEEHPALGGRIASEMLTSEQVQWIRGHHERWDGSGYPDRLAGDLIPEGAQILAIADAFDVMTHERVYQDRRADEDAIAECRTHAGTQFAPTVVDALAAMVAAGFVADGTSGSQRAA